MSKISELRPAPRRSPERQKLADALDALRAIDSELVRLRDAQERAEQPYVAIERREAAEKALAEARAAEAEWQVRVLLGEVAGDGPIAVAQDALTVARAKEHSARQVHEVLDRRAEEMEKQRAWKQSAVMVAVYATIAASTEIDALLDRYAAIRREAVEIEEALDGVILGIPHARQYWRSDSDGRRGVNITEVQQRPHVAAWRGLYTALQNNPDAPLPLVGAQLPPPPVAA